jgi:hypothetical protein
MRRAASAALFLLGLLSLLDRALAEDRATFPIEKWEVTRATRGGPPGKFQPGAPSLPFAANQEDVIARAVFELPAEVSSRALVLELGRVRFEATVALDGIALASSLEGDVRIALAPLAAGRHELLVRARDVRAAAVPGRKVQDDEKAEAAWLEPIGAAPRSAGILGEARLVERSPVEVRSVFVEAGAPRSGVEPRIVLEVEGATGEPADVGFTAPGIAPRSERVTLAPGERGRVELPWPEAPRWAPDSPHRAPVSVLISGRTVRRIELAARALAIRDGRLALDGRGVPFFLVDAPRGQGESAAREAIALARTVGATALATRGERDERWLDTVEAAGFLVLYESDLGPPVSAYALDDERLWRALRRQVLSAVERHRGHAAVAGWGIARSVLAEGGAGVTLARERLAALASEVRALDPSRPVFLPEDDGRSLGVETDWRPAEEASSGAVARLPAAATPRALERRVALAGDPGFLDDGAVGAAHARARARLALEARGRGALGLDLGAAPSEPTAVAELARALERFALVAKPAPGGGELEGRPVRRTFTLVNDLDRRADVAVAWSLTWTGAVDPAASGPAGKLELGVDSGERASFDVVFRAPRVPSRREGTLHVAAVTSGARALATGALVVWPERAAPVELTRPVLLYDAPSGSTGEALLQSGVAWREAPVAPAELEPESVLVVGEGALDDKATRETAVALVERARRVGAGTLVLRQETPFPPGVAPSLEGQEPRGAADLTLEATAGIASIASSDLVGWPERALAPPGLERPLRADARVLVAGAPSGLGDACAVCACDDGSGREVVCQIALARRVDSLPAARALLGALVRAASERPPRIDRPFFARTDRDVELALEGVALPPRSWSAAAISSAREPVILLEDTKLPPLARDESDAIEEAVARGGTLVVGVAADTTLARLGPLAAPGLTVEKAPSLPRPAAWGPLEIGALDLLWPPGPGAPRELGSRFDAAPRAARLDGASALLEPGALLERPYGRGRVLFDLVRWREALNQAAGKRYLAKLLRHVGAETREPKLRLPAASWNGVGRKDDTVQFFANATATARFFARREGRYRVTLELGGQPAHGIWPLAKVHVDAQDLGQVSVLGAGPALYEREVVIRAGSHVISVSFVNDVLEPPEDRNMFLQGATLELLPPRIY